MTATDVARHHVENALAGRGAFFDRGPFVKRNSALDEAGTPVCTKAQGWHIPALMAWMPSCGSARRRGQAPKPPCGAPKAQGLTAAPMAEPSSPGQKCRPDRTPPTRGPARGVPSSLHRRPVGSWFFSRSASAAARWASKGLDLPMSTAGSPASGRPTAFSRNGPHLRPGGELASRAEPAAPPGARTACPPQAVAVPQRNGSPLRQIVCMTTASLRARAARALFMPTRLLNRTAHALSVDQRCTLARSVVAASNSKVRTNGSPHRETAPERLVSPIGAGGVSAQNERRRRASA